MTLLIATFSPVALLVPMRAVAKEPLETFMVVYRLCIIRLMWCDDAHHREREREKQGDNRPYTKKSAYPSMVKKDMTSFVCKILSGTFNLWWSCPGRCDGRNFACVPMHPARSLPRCMHGNGGDGYLRPKCLSRFILGIQGDFCGSLISLGIRLIAARRHRCQILGCTATHSDSPFQSWTTKSSLALPRNNLSDPLWTLRRFFAHNSQ